MPALVTDKFRIINATSFIDSVNDSSNSFYVFVGLSNPSDPSGGYGRDSDWDSNTPSPIDNVDYLNHYKSTILFGKKITSANIKRAVRKITWSSGTTYEMYRSDYSILNPSPVSGSLRLHDANYYVVNSDFRVYICIDNGASGINTRGNSSQVEPTFTDLEPSKLSDGYTWKYLYTISPSDIVKFDTIEYITLPNNWSTSTDPQISSIRDNGDSSVNNNQIKKVYIENQGSGYNKVTGDTANIIGDGSGGEVSLVVTSNKITDVIVTSGGKNYTYGIIDLQTSTDNIPGTYANLIPIIPPSKGHGYDLYEELGADRVLIYARFDDSTKDFPIGTQFSQIGILKNPTIFDSTGVSTSLYTSSEFSAVYSAKVNNVTGANTLTPGEKIRQNVTGGVSYAYVASFEPLNSQGTEGILKYYRDRSLYYNGGGGSNHQDFIGINTFVDSNGSLLKFDNSSTSSQISSIDGGFTASIDETFSGITTTVTNSIINLGVEFNNGIAEPEINNKSGSVIYIDNRETIARNARQKEDVKIILEF